MKIQWCTGHTFVSTLFHGGTREGRGEGRREGRREGGCLDDQSTAFIFVIRFYRVENKGIPIEPLFPQKGAPSSKRTEIFNQKRCSQSWLVMAYGIILKSRPRYAQALSPRLSIKFSEFNSADNHAIQNRTCDKYDVTVQSLLLGLLAM